MTEIRMMVTSAGGSMSEGLQEAFGGDGNVPLLDLGGCLHALSSLCKKSC